MSTTNKDAEVIELLQKRDQLNTTIQVRSEHNAKIDKEVEELFKQGKDDFDLDITEENYPELLAKFEEDKNLQCQALRQAIEDVEKWL